MKDMDQYSNRYDAALEQFRGWLPGMTVERLQSYLTDPGAIDSAILPTIQKLVRQELANRLL